jgi:ribosomal protein S18 acetylase RimI-like enzyme
MIVPLVAFLLWQVSIETVHSFVIGGKLLFVARAAPRTMMNHHPNQDPPIGIHFRPLTDRDSDIVWQMLMHAAHEPMDVREVPILIPYGQDYGKKLGDVGIVAVMNNEEAIGAAWVRLIGGGFGYISDHIPELVFAILPEYRGQGIGTRLLRKLLDSLQQQSIQGVSLSCRDDNPAVRLYERMGFVRKPGSEETNRAGGISFTMVLKF